MYVVYVLRSTSTGKLYIGQSGDLPRRLLEHELGLARYSRGRGPWEMIFTEEYAMRAEAMRRERFLKSGQGRTYLKYILVGRAGPPEAD